jgi:hypothetical protein
MRLKEMISFFDYARNAGLVSPNTVHNWLGAISAISQSLNDEERTVEFIQRYPNVVRERLASTKRDVNPRTMDAYRARASTAISNFLLWKEDPMKWERDLATKPQKLSLRPRRAPVVVREKARPIASAPAPAAPVSAAREDIKAGRGNMVRIATEKGENICLEFPEHFVMSDVTRVAWALAAHADDFDPEVCLRSFGNPHSLQAKPSESAH